MPSPTYYNHVTTSERRCMYTRKKYGVMAFLFDLLMTALTGGCWLIWIFVREMRGQRGVC